MCGVWIQVEEDVGGRDEDQNNGHLEVSGHIEKCVTGNCRTRKMQDSRTRKQMSSITLGPPFSGPAVFQLTFILVLIRIDCKRRTRNRGLRVSKDVWSVVFVSSWSSGGCVRRG